MHDFSFSSGFSPPGLSRRGLLLSSLGVLSGAALGGCAARNGAQPRAVHIGYQVSGDLTRERGILDRRLAERGVALTWAKFINGPPLLEALNVGSIDLGWTGETPPIFAQLAGADLIYAANIPARSDSAYVLVTPINSGIETVAQLKGKKVAYPRGTAATYFLGQVLKQEGLRFDDVQQVNLQLGDYAGAIRRNEVAAFVTAEVLLLRGGLDSQVRTLRDGNGITTPGTYYLAARRFAIERADLLKIILEEYNNSGQWRNAHPREAAQYTAGQLNVPADRLEALFRKNRFVMRPIDEAVIDLQQRVADFLYDVKVIARRVDIRAATLTPEQYAAITPEALRSAA